MAKKARLMITLKILFSALTANTLDTMLKSTTNFGG
jgi:hypothetical protein